jgi:hypothetical protein
MNDTINNKQSTEDGGAVGKPAVRRSLFHRLNWSGFWVIAVLSLLAALANENLAMAKGMEYVAAVGIVWAFGLAVAGFFLIEGRERLVRERWEYGTCAGKKARRHTGNGNVQFVLWRKGDQKEVDGIGHLEDKWVDFDRSWWSLFVSDDCA